MGLVDRGGDGPGGGRGERMGGAHAWAAPRRRAGGAAM